MKTNDDLKQMLIKASELKENNFILREAKSRLLTVQSDDWQKNLRKDASSKKSKKQKRGL